jgi:hypothetical protein
MKDHWLVGMMAVTMDYWKALRQAEWKVYQKDDWMVA